MLLHFNFTKVLLVVCLLVCLLVCHRKVLSSQSFAIAKFCHCKVCHRKVLSSQSLSSHSFVITKFCHPDEGRNTQETPQRNSATKLRNALSSYLCDNLCRATCAPIFVELLVCSFLRQDDKTLRRQNFAMTNFAMTNFAMTNFAITNFAMTTLR